MSEHVLVFVKAPVPGLVKTRLARSVGDATAAALYAAFGLDMIRSLVESGLQVHVVFAPESPQSVYEDWLGRGYSMFPQQGDDLGERMADAFRHVFAQGAERAVLVGSDLPEMPPERVVDALTVLRGSAAVFGPAGDGGYYLAGFSKEGFEPRLFQGIAWSTDAVYSQTLKRMQELGVNAEELPVQRDVDTGEDLERLAATLDEWRDHAPLTAQILEELEAERDATC